MKWNLSSPEYLNLASLIGEALGIAFRDTSQSEPQLIANLVWALPRSLNNRYISSGVHLSCGGVFVHGQPFVHSAQFPASSPKSVEIGDILILCSINKPRKKIERRAMLLQAKKYKSLPTTPDNPNQLYLYEHWPSFIYASRSTSLLTGQRRHIKGTDLVNASKYLLIKENISCSGLFPRSCCLDLRYNSKYPFYIAQASSPQLSHFKLFGKELIDFILGDAGKAYTVPAPPRFRQWSKVIEDLTAITAQRQSVFMGRSSKKKSSARGQGTLQCLSKEMFSVGSLGRNSTLAGVGVAITNEAERSEIPPIINEEFPEGDEFPDGISIIEFIVNDENERE